MLKNVDELNPPIQYRLIWLIIGAILVLAIAAWYGYVFWNTRKKKARKLDDLQQLPPPVNLEALKAKYFQLIEAAYQAYIAKTITLRDLHQYLSLYVRYFVYEANGFPAPLLTLNDLKLAPYPKLTVLIEDYYPKEFAAIVKGDALESKNAAIGFITQWPF